jgi:hypothetical protein
MPRVANPNVLPALKVCKNPNCGMVATSFDGLCPAHAPIRRLKNYTSRPRVPRAACNPIGVELEMQNRQRLNNLTTVARFVCSDGSIGYDGGEIKLVQDASKISNLAADTTQRAALAGCEADKRCGFHVHLGLDADQYHAINNSEAVHRLYAAVKHIEPYFFDIVPRSRRKNQYCSTVNAPSFLFNHYSWVSLSRRVPTIEVRIHGGTTNAWKVKAWVDVCIELKKYFLHAIESTAHFGVYDSRFSNNLPSGSLAQKYLFAREIAGGSLKNFGF